MDGAPSLDLGAHQHPILSPHNKPTDKKTFLLALQSASHITTNAHSFLHSEPSSTPLITMTSTIAMTCERILAKNPNAVPVVLQGGAKATVVALAPTATVSDVIKAAREAAGARTDKPVTITVDGCTPSSTTTVADLRATCQSEDGFLYVAYSAKATTMGNPCMPSADAMTDALSGSVLSGL